MNSKMKRGIVNGFDGITGKETRKRLNNWKKNQPAGRWRAVQQIRIRYTYITQTWHYADRTFSQRFISPFGMTTFMKETLQDEKLYRRFVTLPVQVKEALSISKENYDPQTVRIECSDEGDKGFDNFYVLFCTTCKRDNYPLFIQKYKTHLPENPQIEHIQEHWDELVKVDNSIIKHFLDLCGCILPNEPEILAAPNNRRFILRPIEHSEKHHKIDTALRKGKRPSEDRNNDPDCIVVPKKSHNTLTGNKGQLSMTSQSSCNVKTAKGDNIKVKLGRKVKLVTQPSIASMIDPKVSIFDKPHDAMEEWSQDYALSVVLSGANKNLSQAATVHLYNTAIRGVRGYHKTVFSDVEIDGKKVSQPPRVALNQDNISRFQSGLLEAYKNIGDSPYQALQGELSKFYSIFNDGIQKFTMELNGVMIRTLDTNWKITNVPWALNEIPGGSMDSTKLCAQIMSVISNLNNFKKNNDSAYKSFLRQYDLKYPDKITPSPPSVFKCTTLENIDWEEKTVYILFDNWPVALVGDGCSVNKKAGELLTTHIGLLSPSTRCSAHAASGSMRRMTTSKTMCVPEVVTFAAGLKPILKHFKLSGKSSTLLKECLQIMEMKSYKLMTWCPTRMANLLECSTRTARMLLPICDMLATTGIKSEEASYFLSPICLSILHLMSDLDDVFVKKFLRKLDTDDATLFEVFRLSENFTHVMNSVETPLFDSFLNGLSEDANGNIIYTKHEDGKTSSITLNYKHRQNRNGQTKIETIKAESIAVKEKVKANLIENVEDQSQTETIIEYASAFDLFRKCDKVTRISYIKQLFGIYGQDYIHKLSDEYCSLDGFTVKVKYPAMLKCTETELISEFNSLWPIMNKKWLQFKASKPANIMKRFWIHILEEHCIEYPNIADLVMIILSISPGTGPLERSFSKLAKICYKDRGNISSKVLEVLYLLSTLGIDESHAVLFNKTRDILQNK